jgi:hypothetical protein
MNSNQKLWLITGINSFIFILLWYLLVGDRYLFLIFIPIIAIINYILIHKIGDGAVEALSEPKSDKINVNGKHRKLIDEVNNYKLKLREALKNEQELQIKLKESNDFAKTLKSKLVVVTQERNKFQETFKNVTEKLLSLRFAREVIESTSFTKSITNENNDNLKSQVFILEIFISKLHNLIESKFYPSKSGIKIEETAGMLYSMKVYELMTLLTHLSDEEKTTHLANISSFLNSNFDFVQVVNYGLSDNFNPTDHTSASGSSIQANEPVRIQSFKVENRNTGAVLVKAIVEKIEM